MLQVIRRTFIITLIAAAIGLPFKGVRNGDACAASAPPPEVKWLLDDAMKEEYVPLVQTSVILPQDYQKAIDNYKTGNYQAAVRVLEDLRAMNLPDGRHDFICFALGESYRMLRLKDFAAESYRQVVTHFPSSDKVAPSWFRLLQYAYGDKDTLLTDSICGLFQRTFRGSQLYFPVLYVTALLRFSQERYNESMQILSQIAPQSSQFPQAQFLMALCHLQKKEWEKALLILDYVRKSTAAAGIADEAAILIADVYFNKGSYSSAIRYYRNVPRSARRYDYTLVKIARSYLELGQAADARDCALTFIQKNKASEYFFEMVSILEQAYTKLKDAANAQRMNGLIFRQVKNARVSFDIYEELGRVSDMVRVWQVIEFRAIQQKNDKLLATAQEEVRRLNALGAKYRDLLVEIGVIDSKKGSENIPGLAERRYLDLLKEQSDRMADTAALFGKKTDSLKAALADKKPDSLIVKVLQSFAAKKDTCAARHRALEQEQQIVMRECLGEIQGKKQADENLQAKFVDWAFLKYQEKKVELSHKTKELSADGQKKAKTDTLAKKSSEVVKLFSSIDIDKLARSLVEDRTMLVSHITSMQYVYPDSRYMPQLLFRLAELYFDQAAEDFDVALRIYEKKMAEAKATSKLYFPEYDLKKVIDTYDRIIRMYPKDQLADAAYFYKALALAKLGRYDEANDVLLELTEKHPESGYYVEANMSIARYYFDHPKVDSGRGYQHAEETYHKVLYYRDHPQFVQALYSLGWCYYMQDRYDEAIAVFKYLVEEVALDFDVTKVDENKQVTNPLLRDEAIDYIAISFDEENRINDAVKFLQLIGNVDYAAMVLKRIAELRVEDMDYPAAVRIYHRLIVEYPQSIVAPDVATSLIKVYEIMNLPDSAMKERQVFFETYSRGGQWQNLVWKRDSLLIPRVDSTAISIGFFLSDASYRKADARKETAGYAAAAGYYGALVQKYPQDRRAADALWNLSVILDSKIDKSEEAYGQYIKFSRLKDADPVRREQAALNAVAIAQRMLPPDTLAEEGKLDGPALKVVEAVNNYRELFPSGKSIANVLLTVASIYFNRKMFANAADYYQMIVKTGTVNEDYWEAMFLLGQCHFGKENWELAAAAFDKVWKGSSDASRRSKAYKLLLQSEFSNGKQAFAAGAYDKAAEVFLGIESKYPGSEYGDIVLFKAAESYEKKPDWIKACDSYYKVQKNYPQSKLAPSALFNAAADYEKANKFDMAAEAYELIVAKYSESDKAKDALFNLGLCYEKIGKLDKMAEANERYTQMYPAEKDVEAMLLRSAQYYYKANMFDKAINAYRSFIRRYPQSPKIIEALFMIGKMYYEKSDRDNATLAFSQAENLNLRLAQAKQERNDYFAAEAAFYLANIKRDDFVAVKFVLPDAKFKADQRIKSSLMTEAAAAYGKVLQYQSERMFEAAYRIGQMYEDMTATWLGQERPKLPAIKLAVLEKDINQSASLILQKSFTPYKKVIELSKSFDTLSAEQKIWVQKSKVSLAKNYFAAGQYLIDAISAIQNAPVPPEIKGKPLYYYQYLKQLLETIDPMKVQTRAYFLAAAKELDSLGLKGENSAKCLEAFSSMNYLTGAEYARLAEKILREPEIPASLTSAEREELSFQLEDVVYELQDKAIFAFEDAMKLAKKENLASGEWFGKIMIGLARLSPEKYGTSVFVHTSTGTSYEWSVRPDSVPGWNGKDIPEAGWTDAHEVSGSAAAFAESSVPYIWSKDSSARAVYAWRNIFLPGFPRDAKAYMMVGGKYWLYVNGTLTSSDTVGTRKASQLDSIVGISKLVKGGDNDISLHVINVDSSFKGCAVFFTTLLDTTQHFTPSGKYSHGAQHQAVAQTASAASAAAGTAGEKKPATAAVSAGSPEASGAPAKETKKELPFDKQFRSRGELLNAIVDYQKKAETVGSEVKKQRLEVQKLRIKTEDLDEQIRKVKEETELLKKQLEGMNRGK
jgi:tetratricopeptide (TPR) repeat protein